MAPMESNTTPMASEDTFVHNIKEMVSRPVVIDRFTWTTGEEVPAIYTESDLQHKVTKYLKKYSFPQDILDKSSLISDKLDNFQFMRADVKFQLQFNATPQQQGMLLITYSPLEGNLSDGRVLTTQTLAGCSSYPHVLVNVKTENNIEFTVPYANKYDYFDLSSPDNQFGNIYVYAISTIRSDADSTSVDVTVKAQFVNPEFVVATDSSLNANQQRAEHRLLNQIKEIGMDNMTDTTKQLLRGIVDSHTKDCLCNKCLKGLVAQGREEESTGPVTLIAKGVSSISRGVSSIPLLPTIAKTILGWTTRAADYVSTFGWGKPTDVLPQTSMLAQPAKYMCNTEGKDYSVMLGQIPDNKVDPTSAFPEKHDEMSLKYVLSRPNIFMRKDVLASQFTGRNLLMEFPYSPYQPSLMANEQVACWGTFSYVSNLYQYYRGSINFTITFIKTRFHAGRVIAIYFPGRATAPPTWDKQMTTNYNQVFDIQQPDSVTGDEDMVINMPMRINIPWLQTSTIYGLDNGERAFCNDGTYSGCIGIYAYNSLVAPDSVYQGITMIARMSAGDSYELARPIKKISAGLRPYATTVIERFATSFNTGRAGTYKKEGSTDELDFEPISIDVEETWDYTTGSYHCAEGYYYAGMQNDLGTKYDGKIAWLVYNNSGKLARIDQADSPVVRIITVDKRFADFQFDADSSYGELVNGKRYTVYLWLPGRNDYEIEPLKLQQAKALMRQGEDVVESPLRVNVDAPVNFSPIPKDEDLVEEISKMTAQAGGSEMLPREKESTIPTSSRDVACYTVGEYTQSLRPLTRRFSRVGFIQPGACCIYHPMHFSISSTTGRSTVDVVQVNGSGPYHTKVVSETWQQLISHIYRFYAGSFRTKIHLSNLYGKVGVSTVNDKKIPVFSTLDDLLEYPDPVYVQNGKTNSILESQVPFYSTNRMQVVGADYGREPNAKPCVGAQCIQLSGSPDYKPQQTEFYAAAGDDFSFGFMVAPPPVTPRVDFPLSL